MTDKQAKFVDEYLVDLNATQAAIRAGYSEKTAGFIGHENLKKPKIAEAIQKRQDELAEAVHVTQEEVIQGLLKEARGQGLDSHTSARVSAWEKLGKFLGMFGAKGTAEDPINTIQQVNVHIINEPQK